ncbi:MAG: glucan biosynthesis protein G [Gammaproteobacteria bacterium]
MPPRNDKLFNARRRPRNYRPAAGVLAVLAMRFRRAGAVLGWMPLALAATAAGAAGRPFGFDNVVLRARELAAQPYRDRQAAVPAFLRQLDYAHYREIRFRPRKALWRNTGLPFQVQFFPVGYYYDRPVTIHVVDGAAVREMAFAPDLFDYGTNRFPEPVPADLGFAGFRVHYRINNNRNFDEFAVFLGASYFRAVGRGAVYGLSARGVAVDTALPEGEQFPYFRAFWLVKPAPGARQLRVYALLDGKNLTGAYQFDIRPGAATAMHVTAVLFPRTPIAKLGLAPLTSMFLYGEGASRIARDFRPEVHDSDGLLIAAGSGEWIWRPLVNPRRLLVSSFAVRSPRGFGFVQRDRSFDHYQDFEKRYALRPNAWVVPEGNWGRGRVELVEIPSDSEHNDNMVAYWVPHAAATPEQPLRLSYNVRWTNHDPSPTDGGRTLATRVTRGNTQHAKTFTVDFAGRRLNALAAGAPIRGVVNVRSGGTLVAQRVTRNPATGGWRLSFDLERDPGAPLDLNAYLADGEHAVTETWSYCNDD